MRRPWRREARQPRTAFPTPSPPPPTTTSPRMTQPRLIPFSTLTEKIHNSFKPFSQCAQPAPQNSLSMLLHEHSCNKSYGFPVPPGHPQADEDCGVGDEGQRRVEGAQDEAEGGGGRRLPGQEAGGGEGREGGGGGVGQEGGGDPRRLGLPQQDAAQLHQPAVQREPGPALQWSLRLDVFKLTKITPF